MNQDLDNALSKNPRLGLAGQIHKLRSNAGMVGDVELYKLASECETTLRSEDFKPVMPLIEKINNQLNAIKKSSKESLKQWFQEQHSRESAPVKEAPPLSNSKKEHLLALLEAQDLDAVDEVQANAPSLQATLRSDSYKNLISCLESLNFKKASTILESI